MQFAVADKLSLSSYLKILNNCNGCWIWCRVNGETWQCKILVWKCFMRTEKTLADHRIFKKLQHDIIFCMMSSWDSWDTFITDSITILVGLLLCLCVNESELMCVFAEPVGRGIAIEDAWVQDCSAGKWRCGQVSSYCPVCSRYLCGKIWPYHRGQLPETSWGGWAAMYAWNSRHSWHGKISTVTHRKLYRSSCVCWSVFFCQKSLWLNVSMWSSFFVM
jgi:hypothetical protein